MSEKDINQKRNTCKVRDYFACLSVYVSSKNPSSNESFSTRDTFLEKKNVFIWKEESETHGSLQVAVTAGLWSAKAGSLGSHLDRHIALTVAHHIAIIRCSLRCIGRQLNCEAKHPGPKQALSHTITVSHQKWKKKSLSQKCQRSWQRINSTTDDK